MAHRHEPLPFNENDVNECMKNNDRNNENDNDDSFQSLSAAPDDSIQQQEQVNGSNNNDNDNPPEVMGLALDSFARGIVFMSSIFLGPALLEQASNAASANDKTFGFRPSSLLSNMAIVSGLLASLLAPLVGAIMDHTPHRRSVGMYTAYGLVVIKGIEIFVGPSTWLLVACLQVCTALLYQPHVATTYAYTSELCDNNNRNSNNSNNNCNSNSSNTKSHTYYNSLYAMVQQIAVLIFCMTVLGLGALFHADTLQLAQLSQTVTTVSTGITFHVAWKYYFRSVPQLKRVPVNKTLLQCGVDSVRATLRRIVFVNNGGYNNMAGASLHHNNSDMHVDGSDDDDDNGQNTHALNNTSSNTNARALQCLLASILVSEAASQTLIAVATTYMTYVLRMDANAIGTVFLAVLLCGIFGAKIGAIVATGAANVRRRFMTSHGEHDSAALTTDPVGSAMCGQVYFCIVTTAACLTLNGPEDQAYVPIFGGLWGVALGWLSPMQASAFMGLVGNDDNGSEQRAEMMGVYLLASNLLSWLPALVFTVLNEAGVSMKWGMASLNIYFLIGLGCLIRMVKIQHNGDMHPIASEELELKSRILPLVV
ncbi:hypothetical protein MPSEU_000327100 [Mayamaea pseudoterrestris]|nr:hypothetical protein MPSEU_000327100 [Mayamaea pseudoterrestris]